MAGIGFELYKILHQGTLSSVLKAFFFGIIIVAGPWILSIICIYAIQKFVFFAISENPALFTVTIVYVYAGSLSLFGGIHYIFSRYIADMLYEVEMEKTVSKREEIKERISSALVSVGMLVILISAVISLGFIYFNDFFINIKNREIYIITLITLFTVINLIWIFLIYVALLKEYNKIFFSYYEPLEYIS